MAKSDLNRGDYECDLYFESLKSNNNYYDEDKIYERCNKCIKDVNPNPNMQLVKLMKENNELLQNLIELTRK